MDRVCITFLFGAIFNSSSSSSAVPNPLDTININLNLYKGKNGENYHESHIEGQNEDDNTEGNGNDGSDNDNDYEYGHRYKRYGYYSRDLCANKLCGEVCDTTHGMLQVMRYCQPDGSCEANAQPDCLEQSLGKCEFSHECLEFDVCKSIQDANCVCNHGNCIIQGWVWPGNFNVTLECETFQDCKKLGKCNHMKEDQCFCIVGTCDTSKWECRHGTNDCNKMEKCKGKKCICRNGVCDLDTD